MATETKTGTAHRLILGVIAVIAVVVATISAAPAERANAAISGSEFDPGYIISDQQFYNANAMTESEIQAFLETRIGAVGGCIDGAPNCLAQMRLTTTTFGAYNHPTTGTRLCEAYQGAASERASTIIFKVQQACGISARVILVTLQKEQRLLSLRSPSDSTVNRAMGYGCPDTTAGACYTTYAGFLQQVYYAARQFKIYRERPYSFNFRAGQTTQILYQANKPECGSRTVTITNAATAGLYNYTPYTPNAAALANLSGTGDACSAYGNRNFWYFYYAWFGKPTELYPTDVAMSRVAGADRFEVAVSLSRDNFAPGVESVHVVSAMNFPDALSAAPAAALGNGPLLLVDTAYLRQIVETELRRLQPQRIVIVGGPGSVSAEVEAALAEIAPVERRGGIDRYEASRNVALATFPLGTTSTAYIATGEGFADALSASTVGAAKGLPVILVSGRQSTPDDQTLTVLEQLGVTKVIIVGGPASVSTGIESALRAQPGLTVERFGGSDRFEVSAALNRASFDSADRVYLASGLVFPDALSGAAVSGLNQAPLYLVPTSCVPRSTIEDVIRVGATNATILGGTASVSSSVGTWRNC